MDIVRETFSVCPVCRARLRAAVVRRGDEFFLDKNCPEHGEFSTVVWRGEPSYEEWGAGYAPPGQEAGGLPDCPDGCGLCAGHLQKTCCALVEVTERCSLACPVCYARSGGDDGPDCHSAEPTVGELSELFGRLVRDGNTFVQLSGGEPAERDDLPEIVAAARDAGCESIQLNSNGLRLGRDKSFVKALGEAGLSFVFMQFDGTEDEIYEKLRGRKLLAEKKAAIANCADEFLGVTLVPTLVPGVNCHNIGDIVSFGFSNSPAVRGVHFQPISYFGRFPRTSEPATRVTLPEVLRAIEGQTGGKLKVSNFAPSGCDHPYCGFHGDFVVLPNNMVMKLTKRGESSCCGPADDAHLRNRSFVSRRWKRGGHTGASGGGSDVVGQGGGGDDFRDLDTFLGRVRSHGFTITAMAFQDVFTLDLERLRRCSLHVSHDGNMSPFCARYL